MSLSQTDTLLLLRAAGLLDLHRDVLRVHRLQLRLHAQGLRRSCAEGQGRAVHLYVGLLHLIDPAHHSPLDQDWEDSEEAKPFLSAFLQSALPDDIFTDIR